MTEQIELIGGPLDGKVVEIPVRGIELYQTQLVDHRGNYIYT